MDICDYLYLFITLFVFMCVVRVFEFGDIHLMLVHSYFRVILALVISLAEKTYSQFEPF